MISSTYSVLVYLYRDYIYGVFCYAIVAYLYLAVAEVPLSLLLVLECRLCLDVASPLQINSCLADINYP